MASVSVGPEAGRGELEIQVPVSTGVVAIQRAMPKPPTHLPTHMLTQLTDPSTQLMDVRRLSGHDANELRAILTNLRAQIAKSENAMAFEIFPDTTILDVIQKLPQSVEELADVDKLGLRKIELYGDRIVSAVSAFLDTKEILIPVRAVEREKATLMSPGFVKLVAAGQYATRFARPSTTSHSLPARNLGLDQMEVLASANSARSEATCNTEKISSQDELDALSDEAIIDLCASPKMPDDIGDEQLEWLINEGVV